MKVNFKNSLKAIFIGTLILAFIYIIPRLMIIYQWDKQDDEIVRMSKEEFRLQTFSKEVFSKSYEIENIAKYLINKKEIINQYTSDKHIKILAKEKLIQKIPNIKMYLDSIKPIEINYIQLCSVNQEGTVLSILINGVKQTKWCEVRHEIYYNCPNLTSYQIEKPSGLLAKDTIISSNLKYGIKIVPHAL